MITNLKLCRLSRHSSSCSNRHLNVNVSLARVTGPESVCVCLMPKCLKCRLSAPLSFSFSARLSFLWLCCSCLCRRHNIRTLPLLIEPIWLLPLSPQPLHNTLSQNSSPLPLLHLTKMSSFDPNALFWTHFTPCAIYLGQSLSSPLGPVNSTSFFAVSPLTKITRILGSLRLAPGQVYFLAPPHTHPLPMYPCL